MAGHVTLSQFKFKKRRGQARENNEEMKGQKDGKIRPTLIKKENIQNWVAYYT